MARNFDYVIIGAGSSGCVLADRLSADPANRVLLVEAGGSEKGHLTEMPLAWFRAMMAQQIGWGYLSEPEPHADDRRIPAPRGKVIGGSGSINGMMYSRGSPADYDQWAQMGARGWSWSEVLPYFRKSEANWRGESEHHGGSGPLTVSRNDPHPTIYPAIVAAAGRMGFAHLDDFHGREQEGFSAVDITTHGGRRGSSAARFLRPAMTRPNLTVVDRALTTRIVIERGRATGIDYVRDSETVRVHAGEVIVSAGTFNSPHLLQLSGIGPADHLRELGIDVVAELPVGHNLQDHASIRGLYEASGPFTFDQQLRFDRMALAAVRWQLTGTGPLTQMPIGAQGFVRTREGLDRPDLQLLVSSVAMDAKVWFPGIRKRRGDYLAVASVLLHPESTGTVLIKSPDPAEKPAIRFNLLATEGDRATFRRIVRFTRELFAQPEAAALVRQELQPGSDVQSDAEIDAFVRSIIGTAMHPTSTCSIGPVVDPELRVHGIAGLRVVDCSVMPAIVGGNTNAPAIMIAEKAADMILGRGPLARAA
ncbi:GMC family oxidoreductase [Sphingomonas baiyangensis]|uniref:Choline dehydrogenase n=1 Tax=Sphingomonas baiyangensis TaxID=2572576 RepID=A0A4U1L3H0_9SPHN|nr:GMC family oxidoreductase N-terminal domain-containing protein [Sphingomonas baiyangensis]TKD50655.1 choline dehydrogenase [Sphingomonas baiyangensis]